MVYECGHTTQKGTPCKRKVLTENTRCPLHTHSDGECSICLAGLTGPCKTLPCGHRFHRRCISQWTHRGHHTCPYCRAPYTDPQPQYRIQVVIENVQSGNTYSHTSNTIPPFISRMNVITPESIFTELLIDVSTRAALTELLTDLGIDSIPQTI